MVNGTSPVWSQSSASKNTTYVGHVKRLRCNWFSIVHLSQISQIREKGERGIFLAVPSREGRCGLQSDTDLAFSLSTSETFIRPAIFSKLQFPSFTWKREGNHSPQWDWALLNYWKQFCVRDWKWPKDVLLPKCDQWANRSSLNSYEQAGGGPPLPREHI